MAIRPSARSTWSARAIAWMCVLATSATPGLGLAQDDAARIVGSSAHLPFRASDVLPLLDVTTGQAKPPLSVGLAPLALSASASDLPAPMAVPREPAAPSWLEGVELPDIPVRWDDRVLHMLRYYRDDPRGRSLMRAWLQRSGRYAQIIRPILRRHGLPEDLVYVAMVESGFDPTAESGVGAVGLWQFMGVSAKEYGLLRSRWVDERASLERSTDAAARLLRDLRDRFGTWELALAAYNMGHGALLRAIRKYNTNDYWLLAELEAGLPYETIVYVAKIMACAVIGHNLERFGMEDLALDPPLDIQHVDIAGGVGLHRVARAAGVEVEMIAALNPELKRRRVPPDLDVYPVRVPRAHIERFTRVWSRRQRDPAAHRTYVVRFGEDLTDIAHTFQTSVYLLKRINGLESEAEVGPGYQLLVPAVEPRAAAAPDGTAAPVVAVPAGAPHAPDMKRIFYTCTGRESPAQVAGFFGVALDDLERWNAITTHAALHEDMVLQLYVDPDRDLSDARVLSEGEVQLLTLGSESFFAYHESQRGRVRVHYRVQPGESLHSLAERFELSVGSIARINGFSRDTQLREDQEILLYVPEAAVAGLSPAQLAAAPPVASTAPAQVD